MNYYAIDNRNNLIVEDATDLLTEYNCYPEFVEGLEHLLMSEKQLTDYITNSEYIYIIDDTGIINRPDSEILESKRNKKRSQLKDDYLESILWTDNEKIFYDKLKFSNPSNTNYDNWYDAVTVYWDESWDEYVIKKQDVIDAETIQEINAIIFNPTHALTKEEIEEMKP